MSLALTQQEANSLLKLAEHYMGNEQFSFPSLGGALRIPLYSNDRTVHRKPSETLRWADVSPRRSAKI